MTDPTGPSTGSKRVVRVVLLSPPHKGFECRERGYATPVEKSGSIGLRVAISGDPQPVIEAPIADDYPNQSGKSRQRSRLGIQCLEGLNEAMTQTTSVWN